MLTASGICRVWLASAEGRITIWFIHLQMWSTLSILPFVALLSIPDKSVRQRQGYMSHPHYGNRLDLFSVTH
jgi:hypothetical protein